MSFQDDPMAMTVSQQMVMAHYNHNEYLPQREAALKAWAERIQMLAADKNVVQLHRPAA